MLRRSGSDSGLIVLGSVLVLGQLIVLMLVVIKLSDSIPKLDPIRVTASSERSIYDTRVVDRHDRTVQSPPAKVASDESTDHVP